MARTHPLLSEILLLEREHQAAPQAQKFAKRIALMAAMERATVVIDDLSDGKRAVEHHAQRLMQNKDLKSYELGRKILELLNPPLDIKQ